MFSNQNIYESSKGGKEGDRPVNIQEQIRAQGSGPFDESLEEEDEGDDYDNVLDINNYAMARRAGNFDIPFVKPFIDQFRKLKAKYGSKPPEENQPDFPGVPALPQRRSQTLEQPPSAPTEDMPKLTPNLAFLELSAAERQKMYADLDTAIERIQYLRSELRQSKNIPSRRTLMGLFGLMTHSLHHAVNAIIGDDSDVNNYADVDIGVGPAARTRTWDDIKPFVKGGGHGHGSVQVEAGGNVGGGGYIDGGYDDRYYTMYPGGYGPVGPGYGPVAPGYGPVAPGYGPVGPGYRPVGPGYRPVGPGHGAGRNLENKIIIQHGQPSS
jgi:hypothetical protein